MQSQIWKHIQNYWAQDLCRRFLWAPVFLGIGIGLYFLGSAEPSIIFSSVLVIFLALFLLSRPFRVFIFPLFFISLGIFIATIRTYSLQTVLIKTPQYNVDVKGKIELIETLSSQEKRITLALENNTHVRLKIKGTPFEEFKTGDQIQGKAHLFPFSVPLIEGTYHFRRQAFFQNLSAQGILKGETLRVIQRELVNSSLQSLRRFLTERIYAILPGENGGIVAALITGEKTKIPKTIRDDYTNSGLSHILAISGLHVGLVAGFIFFLFRNLLALIPSLSLTFHTKKIASFLCIPLLLFYMAISGFGTPVIRSFLMTSVVLFGIMVDRVSISMNMIAIAAFVILILFPESLVHPSFQLSFAAVFALISVYESNWAKGFQASNRGWRKIVFSGVGLALTSIIATLATFPLTIATFNRFTLHAIEANMLGVPLMGLWIMPFGVLFFILIPFGLESLALIPMGWGVSWLNIIAHEVGSWSGSNILVATPPLWSLNMIIFSLIWIGIWKAKWRMWSIPFLCIGIYGFIVPGSKKPDLLFDPLGKAWAFRDENVLLTYPNVRKSFDLELWSRALGIEKVETISPHDVRFKCDKWGCLLRKENIYIQFRKYPKRRNIGTVLSYFPKNDNLKSQFFHIRGKGFIVNQRIIFKPSELLQRPWN